MKHILFALALLISPTLAHAGVPFQFAAPNLRAPDDPDVNGVRLSIFHGRNHSVRGLDLGFFALTETTTLSGFSAVSGIHKLTGDMSGFATGLINIHSGSDTGMNAAFINRVRTVPNGANVAFVNIADEYTLLDVGGFNLSDRSLVQVGFVNFTRKLTGVQIGFLNFAENGFLPVFPIFNFPKN